MAQIICRDEGMKSLAREAPVCLAQAARRDVFFRALVDLGTGGVAGIEAARVKPLVRDVHASTTGPFGGVGFASDALGAWGEAVRDPAAYLLRGTVDADATAAAARLGLAPERIIFMYDMGPLLAAPFKAVEALVAVKRAGSRILLDNFDLDDPPARFMELLPADILRVAPRRMPGHWDQARRQDTMASLMRFADNLLMDVAVEGVESSEQGREFKRLGVRYVQGGWRLDTLGLVPDPGRM